jgi:hypothetical protein
MSQKKMFVIGGIPQETLKLSGLVYVREKMSLQARESIKRFPKSINNRKIPHACKYRMSEAKMVWNRPFLWYS